MTAQQFFKNPFAIALLCLGLIWLMGFSMFAQHISKTAEPLSNKKTDAIIVLTGGPNRIHTGLDMVSNGLAEKLFISGVNNKLSLPNLIRIWNNTPARTSVTGAPTTHSQTYEDLECCIYLGREAKNTYENADESHRWVKEQDIQSITLVTAHYHMPRARLEFKARMPLLPINYHPVFPIKTKPYTINFWTIAFIEYHKTIFTWLRTRF